MNHELKAQPTHAELLDAIREHLDTASELFDDYVAGADHGGGPNIRLASEYDASAGVMRRRAARPDRSAEQAADDLRRAEWYERRAAVMRVGGRMPADLRTPQESLALVHELREALLGLASMMVELSVPDVVAFTGALVDEGGANVAPVTPESATTALGVFVDQISNVLGMLGGRQRAPDDPIVLLPYGMPTYEVVSSSLPGGPHE